MRAGEALDLIILVPGRDEREVLDGLLGERRPSLAIRDLRYEFATAVMRDSGCFRNAPAILRPYCDRAAHALVLFDHFGSGQSDHEADQVEDDLRARLAANGWDDRAEVLVIEPELEIWVWSASPVVDEILGWGERQPPLRQWLKEHGGWPEDQHKPPKPKASVEAALREARIPRSPRLYRKLAERVSLALCQDRAFQRLVTLLRRWFPPE
jgi:hypothetical protein